MSLSLSLSSLRITKNNGAIGTYTVRLRGTIDGGGELFGDIRMIELAGALDGGGDFAGVMVIEQRLAGEVDGGGRVIGSLDPLRVLRGAIEGGGDLSGRITLTTKVAGTLDGGGDLAGRVALTTTIAGELEGGGDLIGDIQRPIDPDAYALIQAMTSAPTSTRADVIEKTVVALKDAGIWDKLDALYMLGAHHEQASRLNWINPGVNTATVVSTPTFTADQGWLSSGSGNTFAGLTSNWVPSTHADKFALGDATIFGKLSTQMSAATQASMLGDANPHGLYPWLVLPSNAFQGSVNRSGGSIAELSSSSNAGTSDDLHAIVQDGSNHRLWRNDQMVTDYASFTAAESLSSRAFAIGCAANADGYGTAIGAYIGVAGWGARLTPSELFFLNKIIASYFAALPGGSWTDPLVDLDAEAIIDEMTTPPDGAQADLIRETVAALKAERIWDRLDVLYMMASHDEQAGRINWKSPGDFTLVSHNNPTFAQGIGFSSNGSTSYLDTGFVPSTDAAIMTAGAAEYHIRPMSSVTGGDYFGAISGGDDYLRIMSAGGGGQLRAFLHSGGINADLTISNREQVFFARRSGSSVVLRAADGSQGSNTVVGVDPGFPTHSITILALNNAGSPVSFLNSSTPVGVFACGGLLSSDVQRDRFSDIVEDYLANI